ncbi:helix-turn-helix domain-containing protein [Candidatus Woesearchaeota archaeon]|nr:helix-turn-helix domain-containing protein [Candidatus Woesearchaeota archaeon]
MNLSERLGRCHNQYQEMQARELLLNFNEINSVLMERSRLSRRSIGDLKLALDDLKKLYESGNQLLRQSLEKSMAELEKEYQKKLQLQEKVDLSDALEVDLLLNINGGDKELLVPVKWDDILGKQNNHGNIAEKLYEIVSQIMLTADLHCDEKCDFAGYVRIISRDVRKKPEINQLSASDISGKISEKLASELKDSNIAVNVVCSNMSLNGYVPSVGQEPENKGRSKYFSGNIFDVIDLFACVPTSEVASYLDIKLPSVLNKVKSRHIHGVQKGKSSPVFVPMHDLVTYVFNHPRLEKGKPTGAHAFSMSAVELDEKQFALYKSEVGDVSTVNECAEAFGLTRKGVQNMISRSQLHGVKHKGQWYVPNVEVEFVKYLRSAKEGIK